MLMILRMWLRLIMQMVTGIGRIGEYRGMLMIRGGNILIVCRRIIGMIRFIRIIITMMRPGCIILCACCARRRRRRVRRDDCTVTADISSRRISVRWARIIICCCSRRRRSSCCCCCCYSRRSLIWQLTED